MADEPITREDLIGLSVLAGGVGLAAVILGLTQRGGNCDEMGCLAPLKAGESLTRLRCESFDNGPLIEVYGGDMIHALMPKATYVGPGRDVYGYLRIMQKHGSSSWVTVYGSGLSGTHFYAANTPTESAIVPTTQVQPVGCESQALCAMIHPGPTPTPFAGALPRPGLGSAVLEIYECAIPGGPAECYSSPTLNRRVPVARRIWFDKINFVS